MFRIVARLRVTARAIERRSPFTSVTPALSIAMSVPVPMAMPTSAFASAGASLMPSPAIATTWRSHCASSTTRTLSAGKTSAITCSIPSFLATASAVRRLSPVTITTRRPASRSARSASCVDAVPRAIRPDLGMHRARVLGRGRWRWLGPRLHRNRLGHSVRRRMVGREVRVMTVMALLMALVVAVRVHGILQSQALSHVSAFPPEDGLPPVALHANMRLAAQAAFESPSSRGWWIAVLSLVAVLVLIAFARMRSRNGPDLLRGRAGADALHFRVPRSCGAWLW